MQVESIGKRVEETKWVRGGGDVEEVESKGKRGEKWVIGLGMGSRWKTGREEEWVGGMEEEESGERNGGGRWGGGREVGRRRSGCGEWRRKRGGKGMEVEDG